MRVWHTEDTVFLECVFSMFGQFQQSSIRIELPASQQDLAASLLKPAQLRQWLFPQRLSNGLPETLEPGLTFTSWITAIPIQHQVEQAGEESLRLLLSQGIDGFHEWQWGEGWVQSRLEGVSILPLQLGQTFALMRLRQFLTASHPQAN